MKTSLKIPILFLALVATAVCARSQGTAFTYQGRLNNNGVPASGTYDLQFTVYDSAGGATVIAGPLTGAGVPVANGLFTASLDFGTSVFTGPARWLQIGVRTNGGGSFVALNPRQALTPTPYAIFAATASNVVSGSVVKSVNGLKDDVTLAAGAHVTLTPSGNTLTISSTGGGGSSPWLLNGPTAYYNAGNVGIGTASPSSKLEILAQDALTLTGSEPFLTLRDSNAGNARNTIQAVAGGMNLFTESYLSGADPSAFVRLANSGNLGLGSINPASKLEIVGQNALSMIGFQPFLTFYDSNAGYARSRIQGVNGDIALTTEAYIASGGANPGAGLLIMKNSSGHVGIGTATPVAQLQVETGETKPAIYGNATAAGTGVYGRSVSGIAVYADGDAGQAREKGGFVKAMAKVNADASIARQFSAIPGTITASQPPLYFGYRVTFPFPVNDRFISVTPYRNGSVGEVIANVFIEGCLSCGPNDVDVIISNADNPSGPPIANEFFIFDY